MFFDSNMKGVPLTTVPFLLIMVICNVYLWINWKQKVSRNNVCTLETLQIEIWNVILEIMEHELHVTKFMPL
jgi:hypothetical protein